MTRWLLIIALILLVPIVPFLLMLSVNQEIALFFNRRGGPFFAFRALMFHQVYYLYSASAFAWTVLERLVGKLFRLEPLS